MSRKAYLLIGANVDALPSVMPAWLIAMADVFHMVRQAMFETEQAVSVVVEGNDDERSKATRCAHILREFTKEHFARVEALSCDFAIKRGTMQEDFAQSIGFEVSALVLACANIRFRADILHEVTTNAPDWKLGETCVFMCLAESCRNQTAILDFLRGSVVSSQQVQSTPDA